jgi:hypothetical protein
LRGAATVTGVMDGLNMDGSIDVVVIGMKVVHVVATKAVVAAMEEQTLIMLAGTDAYNAGRNRRL